VGPHSFAIYLVALLNSLGLDVPSWVSAIPLTDVISISFIAPLLLAGLTAVLCHGAKDGALLNFVLTTVKVPTSAVVVRTRKRECEPPAAHDMAANGP
jgi:basic amino acid/polyamine antiporter, APA family